MITVSTKLTFYIAHATSLKDKRQVCRSIIDKARQRFNASVAEVDTQDIHQTSTVGVAVVSGDAAHAQRSLDDPHLNWRKWRRTVSYHLARLKNE